MATMIAPSLRAGSFERDLLEECLERELELVLVLEPFDLGLLDLDRDTAEGVLERRLDSRSRLVTLRFKFLFALSNLPTLPSKLLMAALFNKKTWAEEKMLGNMFKIHNYLCLSVRR